MYRIKPVTKRDVANKFNLDLSSIRQIGKKQLFYTDTLIISYLTIVGELVNSEWVFTDKTYSVTTTQHINLIRKLLNSSQI